MILANLSRIALLGLVMVGRLLACSCGPGAFAPACERVSTATVVFVGTVVAAEPDPGYSTPNKLRVYRFSVEMAYKGLPANVTQILVNPDNFTSCQTQYRVGKRYLIFGSRIAGINQVISGGCAGSRLADDAKEDIEFLEAYRLGTAGNSVFGRVLQWRTDVGRPRRSEDAAVAGANVVLRNGSRVLTQRTTAGGDFRFSNVPAGTYTLSAELAPYTAKVPATDIRVPAIGCVEHFPVLEARASLSGVLIDEAGKPAPRQRVELLRRNGSGSWYSTYQFWKQTDDNGQFRFDGLPDGDYLLGHEIWGDRPSDNSPYGTTYYPGIAERAAASVIHLAPLRVVENLRFSLGKPHTSRTIKVMVTWPDGRAPDANLLQLLNGSDLIKNVGGIFRGRPSTPHNGILEFAGYAERPYELSVKYWVDDLGGPVPYDQQRIARSQVVRLSPAKEPATVKLILTRTMLADEDPR